MTPEIFTSDPSWPYSKAKTAVLAAASAVIREEGPRAATLKNIATRAGITEPAIFRHFDGVDGLFGGLFSVYERVYERSSAAYAANGQGLAKLRAVAGVIVDNIAASRDFAYILIHARHVFRGYADFKAKIAENDAKDQGMVLACVNEGVKAGELRSDIDPASAAVSLLGSIYLTAVMWIESGFGFDIRGIFEDRWDDFARAAAVKPASKSREAKVAARERAASYFPLRPVYGPKSRAGSAKKSSSKAESPRKAKASKAGVKQGPKAAKAAPKRAAAAKAVAKKPATRGK
jgi:TetR/AcrR family transcriptional regulator, fatty acid metabolism regulator protein